MTVCIVHWFSSTAFNETISLHNIVDFMKMKMEDMINSHQRRCDTPSYMSQWAALPLAGTTSLPSHHELKSESCVLTFLVGSLILSGFDLLTPVVVLLGMYFPTPSLNTLAGWYDGPAESYCGSTNIGSNLLVTCQNVLTTISCPGLSLLSPSASCRETQQLRVCILL